VTFPQVDELLVTFPHGLAAVTEAKVQQRFDVFAATWSHRTRADLLLSNNDERRHVLDAEEFDQLRLLAHLDTLGAEGLVILPPLQDL